MAERESQSAEPEVKLVEGSGGLLLDIGGRIVPNYEATFGGLAKGDDVSGIVVRVDAVEILVDVGYKSEGFIARDVDPLSGEPRDSFELGEELTAPIIALEDHDGRLILANERARAEQTRPLVIDGSNIGKIAGGPLDLAVLRDAAQALRCRDPAAAIVTVVDRHEAYRGDVPDHLRAEVKQAFASGEFAEPPVNVIGGADGFILSMAEQHGAVVVSNAAFRDHVAQFPWLGDGDRLLGADNGPLGWTFMWRATTVRP